MTGLRSDADTQLHIWNFVPFSFASLVSLETFPEGLSGSSLVGESEQTNWSAGDLGWTAAPAFCQDPNERTRFLSS